MKCCFVLLFHISKPLSGALAGLFRDCSFCWAAEYIHVIEPAHDRTYNKTCVTSKYLDQPVHPPSMARVLMYPSLDRLEAIKGTYDQARLLSDCSYAQAYLDLRWSHKSYCRF